MYDQSGITLITSSVRRPPPDVLDPKIHHNNLLTSILAKIEANVAGRGRRGHARPPRVRRRDQRDALVPGDRRACWARRPRRLPGGHHPGRGAGAGRAARGSPLRWATTA